MRLVVPAGASAEAIARQLADLGLVRHPLVFRALARSRGVGGRLKAGEYALSGPLSLEGILDDTRAGRRRAPRPDHPGGEGPRRDRRARGGGGPGPRGVPRGRARPLAGARPRSRRHRPRGLPLPGHLRPPAVAGGAAGPRAPDDRPLPRGHHPAARADRGEGADGAAGRDPRVDRRAGDGRRRRAPPHRGGLPQPAPQGDAAPDRPLGHLRDEAGGALGRQHPQARPRHRLALQHLPPAGPAPGARSAPRAARRSSPSSIPRRRRSSTS